MDGWWQKASFTDDVANFTKFFHFFHPIIIIVDFFAKRQQFHGLESWNYFSFYDLNMIMHFLRNWEPTYSFWQK